MRRSISASPVGVPETSVRPSATMSDFSQRLIQTTTSGRMMSTAGTCAALTIAGHRSVCGVICSPRAVVI